MDWAHSSKTGKQFERKALYWNPQVSQELIDQEALLGKELHNRSRDYGEILGRDRRSS